MSYSKCKTISIKPKTNQIFLTVADNNVRPLDYNRCEYGSKIKGGLDDKLMYLMISMLDGNIQISQFNKSTIPFEYALIKIRKYYRQNNISEYEEKYDKRYELYDKEISKYVDIKNWGKRFKFEKENEELTNDIEKNIYSKLYKEELRIFKSSINEQIDGKYYLKDSFERVIEYVRETNRGYSYRAYEEPNKECLLDYKLAYILKDRMGKDYEITKFEERQENRENFEDEEEEYEQ